MVVFLKTQNCTQNSFPRWHCFIIKNGSAGCKKAHFSYLLIVLMSDLRSKSNELPQLLKININLQYWNVTTTPELQQTERTSNMLRLPVLIYISCSNGFQIVKNKSESKVFDPHFYPMTNTEIAFKPDKFWWSWLISLPNIFFFIFGNNSVDHLKIVKT